MDRDYWFQAKGICGKETVMAKETQSASTNTIRLHRVLRAAPEKVYRACLDYGYATKSHIRAALARRQSSHS